MSPLSEHEQRILENPKQVERVKGMILARMKNEDAVDLSDSEIERTLGPCVAGGRLIRLAKALRVSRGIRIEDANG